METSEVLLTEEQRSLGALGSQHVAVTAVNKLVSGMSGLCHQAILSPCALIK